MLFPTISDYKNALVIPESFATLGSLRPEKGLFDDVYFSSGNFAVVFKMRDSLTGKLHAVKCFTREQERRTESLEAICTYLKSVKQPIRSRFIVPYTFLKDEIWVNDAEYPVVLMGWVSGETLGENVKKLCDTRNTKQLHSLLISFINMALWLLEQDWAHGDIKHDNIIVPDSLYKTGVYKTGLNLVDFDGCFIPSMAGQQAREIGSPCYRHPQRNASHFDKHIDDFSILVILISLRTLYLRPYWAEEYNNGENMILSVEDLNQPTQSELLRKMRGLDDEVLKSAVALLDYSLTTPSANVKGLEFLLNDALKILQKETRLFTYEILEPFTNGLAKVKKRSGYGYINTEIEEVIPCQYDEIHPFGNDLYQVLKSRKYGCLDKNGKEICPCIYDKIESLENGKARTIKSGKFGYINQYGEEIIPCVFDEIQEFSNGLSKVKRGWKLGFINESGIEIISCQYDELVLFGNGLIKARKDRKWGLIDKSGKEIVKFIFNKIDEFVEGMVKVEKDYKYGFINDKGVLIVDCIYNNAENFSEGLAKIRVGEKFGFIDVSGKVVIPISFNEVSSFSQGLAAAQKKPNLFEKWQKQINLPYGFIGQNGKFQIQPKYEKITSFSNGLAKVKLNNKYGYINRKGEYVFQANYDEIEELNNGFVKGKIGKNEIVYFDIFYPMTTLNRYDSIESVNRDFIVVKKNQKFGLIGIDRTELLSCLYEAISSFSDSEGLFKVKKDGKWGFIDKTGKIIVSITYEGVLGFYYDKCAVKRHGKWGFIDKEEKIIIPLIFEEVLNFNNSVVAAAKKANKWGFIDKEGKTMVDFVYERVRYDSFENRFTDGYYTILYAIVVKNGLWGCINYFGHQIIPCVYDEIKGKICEKLLGVKKNGKYGFVNTLHEVVIPITYDDVGDFSYDRAPVKRNGKWGYIDKKGNIVIPFQFDSAHKFEWDTFKARFKKDDKTSYNDYCEARVEKNGETFYIDSNGNRSRLFLYG